MTLDKCVRWLVLRHGSLRALSRNTGIDAAYLSRLASGDKQNPSDATLMKLGISRAVEYKLKKTDLEKALHEATGRK